MTSSSGRNKVGVKPMLSLEVPETPRTWPRKLREKTVFFG